MGQYARIDYATYAKGGFLLGAALFVVGAVGELAGHALLGPLGMWNTVLLGMESVGILLALLSPLVFGIALPLVE